MVLAQLKKWQTYEDSFFSDDEFKKNDFALNMHVFQYFANL